jgi:hypothetical protein
VARLAFTFLSVLLLACAAAAQTPAPTDAPVNNEYRVTAFPTHPLFGDFTGFGYLGYVNNTGKGLTTYYVGWPGVVYKPLKWLEGWGGLVYTWNDPETGSNTHEFRPYLGTKVYVPNQVHMNLYNFTRVEWRKITTDDTGARDDKVRVRSRFGFEAPLGSRPWAVQTMYLLGDLEPMYQTDVHAIQTLRARAGIGYVTNHHMRIEVIYHVQMTRKSASDPLAYTDNIFRLNFKIGVKKGLLERLSGAELE